MNFDSFMDPQPDCKSLISSWNAQSLTPASLMTPWSPSDTPPVFAGPFQGIPPPSCWHVSGVLRVLLLNLVVSPNDNGMHGHSYTMLHLYNIMINLQPQSIRAIPPKAHRCTVPVPYHAAQSCNTHKGVEPFWPTICVGKLELHL